MADKAESKPDMTQKGPAWLVQDDHSNTNKIAGMIKPMLILDLTLHLRSGNQELAEEGLGTSAKLSMVLTSTGGSSEARQDEALNKTNVLGQPVILVAQVQ